MFVPDLYKPPSAEHVHAVVSGHPLALLVTNGDPAPEATHLPVVPAPETGDGDLTGQRLLGHLNRANPHWSFVRAGQRGKLVFTGPSAYISPVTYRTTPAAPTWDFVTVHLRGTLHPFAGEEDTLAVVRRTAARFEETFGEGWDQRDSVEYFRSIVGGVGAFEFLVEETEAMYKLSQEKSPETRQRLIDKLLADTSVSSRADVGRFMHAFGLGTR